MRQIPHTSPTSPAPQVHAPTPCHVLTFSASPVVGAGADDDDATRGDDRASMRAMDDARVVFAVRRSVGRSRAREDTDARTCEDGTTQPCIGVTLKTSSRACVCYMRFVVQKEGICERIYRVIDRWSEDGGSRRFREADASVSVIKLGVVRTEEDVA